MGMNADPDDGPDDDDNDGLGPWDDSAGWQGGAAALSALARELAGDLIALTLVDRAAAAPAPRQAPVSAPGGCGPACDHTTLACPRNRTHLISGGNPAHRRHMISASGADLLAARRAVALTAASGDTEAVSLAAGSVRGYERRSPRGREEHVRDYSRWVEGQPGHFIDAISNPQWQQGQQLWQARGRAAQRPGEAAKPEAAKLAPGRADAVKRHAAWMKIGAFEDSKDYDTGYPRSQLGQIADFHATIKGRPDVSAGWRSGKLLYEWEISRQRTEREGPDERGQHWDAYLAHGEEHSLPEAKRAALASMRELRAAHLRAGGDVGYEDAPTGDEIRAYAADARAEDPALRRSPRRTRLPAC